MVSGFKKVRGWFLAALVLVGPASWARDQHFSFKSDSRDTYLPSIQKANVRLGKGLNQGWRLGIVPHHLLASTLIADFFTTLADHNPGLKKIVLLGPDHFHKGKTSVSVTSYGWKTPFGVIPGNNKEVGLLTNYLNLKEDPEAFSGEHSISVLVPFIHHYFPRAKFLPIMIKRNLKNARLEQLFRWLIEASNNETFVLLSMDFSHYKNIQEADKCDQQSLAVMKRIDYSHVWDLDIDCRPGLHLILRLASQLSVTNLEILDHSNSSIILDDPGLKSTTSYFTVLFGR